MFMTSYAFKKDVARGSVKATLGLPQMAFALIGACCVIAWFLLKAVYWLIFGIVIVLVRIVRWHRKRRRAHRLAKARRVVAALA